MNKLVSLFLSRTKTNISILIFCLIAGAVSYINIPKEAKPDVVIPIIQVIVTYDGISAEDSERLLIRPIEQEVRGMDGVKTVKSTGFEGGAAIIIEFKAGLIIEQKLIDVRDRVNRAKPHFPHGTKEPVVSEINLSLFPVLRVKLAGGTLPKRTLYKIAQDLKDDIEANIPSVLKVEIIGGQDELVEILLNASLLNRLNMSFNDISQIIRFNNQMIPAGYIDAAKGRSNLKGSGIIKDYFDIMNMPILADDVSTLMLKDVAYIQKSYKDPVYMVFDRVSLNHSEGAIVLDVSKRLGENLIETVKNIRDFIDNKKAYLPQNLVISYSNDESTHIFDMLTELQNNIILAVILVMAVIIASLGWRSAVLIGIAVPGSFLMGILCLSFLNCTLNIVVLFSLIFSIGMLVDGAIIVVEYADRIMVEKGLSIFDAYIEASKRMAWPVITSISTILVVFLPLLFWPGIVGEFMRYMPITLVCVLTASIFMALVFVPSVAMNLKLKPQIETQNHQHFFLESIYKKILNFVLDRPKKTIICAVLILVLVKVLHSFIGKGIEFFPNIEPDQVVFTVHGRGSLSLEEKTTLVKKAEQRILNMEELSSVVTISGNDSGNDNAKDAIGSITVEFIDWKKRRIATKIIEDILNRFQHIPGIYIDFKKEASGPSQGKPIKIELSSHDYNLIPDVAKKITAYMMQKKELIGVENSLPFTSIDWVFNIDRQKAAQSNVNIVMLGQAIQLLTRGALIASYRPDDATDEVDIVLRFPKEKRSLEYLETIPVTTNSGVLPITNFITYKPQQRVPQIDRVDGRQVITIAADVAPNALPLDEQMNIDQWIKAQNFSKDVSVTFKGEDEDRQETGGFLIKAFGVALFLVWLILLTQFNSFYKSALVLSAVVMSTIGVFVGLMVHSLPFGIVMGGIGVIALSGIIISNNIILIDTFDQLLADFKHHHNTITRANLRDIIIETCVQRLRPVFLTKLTAMLGLLPILFRMELNFLKMDVHFGGPSTEWWFLLSVCIIYGILFASGLTLLVTPCVLWLKEKKALSQ